MDTSFSLLTVSEIVDALPHSTFSNSEQRSHRKLGEAIHLLPTQYMQILTNLAMAKSQRKSSTLEGNNLFLTNLSLYPCIHSLSIKDIVDALPPATFSSRERQSRALLEDVLVGLSDIDQHTLFAVAANKKRKREDLVNDSVDCRMWKKVKLTNVEVFLRRKFARYLWPIYKKKKYYAPSKNTLPMSLPVGCFCIEPPMLYMQPLTVCCRLTCVTLACVFYSIIKLLPSLLQMEHGLVMSLPN